MTASEATLVLGTAQLRAAYGVLGRNQGDPGAEHARALLRTAIKLGFCAFDTAPAYGEAEATIGETGGSLPVHTKIEPSLDPERSLEGSLVRLRRDRVEILYLHDSAEVLQSNSAVIRIAHRLLADRVGLLGASVYSTEEFDAAVADPRIGAIQVPINLLDRRFGGQRLENAVSRGVEVYARSIVLQGVLLAAPAALGGSVKPLRPYVAGFHRVARELGRSPLELAVGWVHQLSGVQGLIVGAETVADLEQLQAACRSMPLSPDELSMLDALPTPPSALCDPRHWTGTTA